jgi:hypothetical protein
VNAVPPPGTGVTGSPAFAGDDNRESSLDDQDHWHGLVSRISSVDMVPEIEKSP